MPTEKFRLLVEVDSRGAKQGLVGLQRSASGVAAALARIAAPVAFGALAKQVVSVGMEFQNLKVRLETVTGSAKAAEQAFAGIRDFAANTPFQLQQVTQAFINLSAKGFAATADNMSALGDMAAAMGTDITHATQAVTQAAFGEAEMLKHWGIQMAYQGDQVKITFDDMTKTVKRDSKEIFQALMEISQANWSGGMDRQAKTLEGRLSTLKDKWTELLGMIAEKTGIIEALTEAVEWLIRAVEDVIEVYENWRAASAQLAASLTRGVGKALGSVARTISQFIAKSTLALQNAPWFLKMILDPTGAGVKSGAGVAVGFTALAEEIESFAEANALAFEQMAQDSLVIDELDGDLNKLAETLRNEATPEVENLEDALKGLLERARNKFNLLEIIERDALEALGDLEKLPYDPFQGIEPIAGEAASEVGDLFADAISDAAMRGLRQALTGGDTQSVINAFADTLGDAIGRIVGQKLAASMGTQMGALAGGLIGAIGGALIGSLLGDVFGGGGTKFVGVISNLEASTGELAAAARSLKDAIEEIRRTTGGIFPMPPMTVLQGDKGFTVGYGRTQGQTYEGEAAGSPLSQVEQVEKAFGSIIFEMKGVGATFQEAMDDFFQQWLARIQEGLNAGQDLLADWPPELVEIIRVSTAQSLEELNADLKRAVEILDMARGEIRGKLFSTFVGLSIMVDDALRLGLNEETIRAALASGIEGVISGLAGEDLFPKMADVSAVLADFATGLEKVGITGKAADRALRDATIAIEIFNKKLELDVLERVVRVMERVPELQKKAARMQAKIDQARFQVEIEILRMQLKSLDLWNATYRKALNQAERWAADLQNFMPQEAAETFSGSVQKFSDATQRHATSTSQLADAITEGAAGKGGTVGWAKRWWERVQALMPAPAGGVFEAVTREYRDLLNILNRHHKSHGVSDYEGKLAALTEAFEAAAQAIWDDLIAAVKKFADSLPYQFGRGTPLEQTADMASDFQRLLAAVLAGDYESLDELQSIASALLQQGVDTFGQASASFAELFDMVMAGLDQVMRMDMPDLLDQTATAVNEQTTALMGGLGSVETAVYSSGAETAQEVRNLNRTLRNSTLQVAVV